MSLIKLWNDNLRSLSGQVAEVDPWDNERVSKYKWRAKQSGTHRKTYYAYIVAYDKRLELQTFILGRTKKGKQIDHRDGDGLNCKNYNLRVLSVRQNQQNRHSETTSKYPGVKASGKKWVASVKYRGKSVHLGTFATEKEAFAHYQLYVLITFGEEVLQPEDNIITVPSQDVQRMMYLMRKDGYSDKEIDEHIALL